MVYLEFLNPSKTATIMQIKQVNFNCLIRSFIPWSILKILIIFLFAKVLLPFPNQMIYGKFFHLLMLKFKRCYHHCTGWHMFTSKTELSMHWIKSKNSIFRFKCKLNFLPRDRSIFCQRIIHLIFLFCACSPSVLRKGLFWTFLDYYRA